MIFFLAQAVAEDIRDIREPLPLPPPWWVWAGWIAGILIACLVLWFLWKKFSRPAQPPLSPFEHALKKLEQAEWQINAGQFREFSFLVSETIREYISARFDIHAEKQTSEEFLRGLLEQTDSPLKPYEDALRDFLHHCDLVKFARGSLSRQEMRTLLERARTLIENSAPQPEDKPEVHAS